MAQLAGASSSSPSKGGMHGRQPLMFLFHVDVSLSLPASSLSLKSINISFGED